MLAFIERERARTGTRVTMVHCVGKIVGMILRDLPEVNCLLRLGRLYRRRDADVFFTVALDRGGEDLSGAVVRGVDALPLVELARELSREGCCRAGPAPISPTRAPSRRDAAAAGVLSGRDGEEVRAMEGTATGAGRREVDAARLPVHALVLGLVLWGAACTAVPHDPRQPAPCGSLPPPPRVVRYLPPGSVPGTSPAFGLVLEDIDGIPTRVLNLSAWSRDAGHAIAALGGDEKQLYERAFVLARERWDAYRAAREHGALAADSRWRRYTDVVDPERLARAICSPVAMTQQEIEGESRVVVAIGLNFRDHAEDAGGGRPFVFPKPVRPTGAYRSLMAPPEVRLLDYEVELGFVALEDIDLGVIPSATDLDGRVAYFLANDVTDREPVARGNIVAGKGRPGFLPMGPWMVHGDDLRPFSSGCPRSLRMRLSVREGDRTTLRQSSETALMINDARAILETLAAAIDPDEPGGTRSHMSLSVDGRERFYPLALMARGRPVLPKGSIVLTGTPGGTAMHAPATLPLLGRALLGFERPTERFIEEQVANRRAEGYLGDGDVVVASIDELGTQWWKVRWGRSGAADPCDQAMPFLR